jgi:hypothetical protein
MTNEYERIARSVVECLWDEHLDLDRFLPALHKAMQEKAAEIAKNSEYEAADHNWAANQEREAKLFLEGLADALAQMEVVIRYGQATTDKTDMGTLRAAAATLQNLRRRMEAA